MLNSRDRKDLIAYASAFVSFAIQKIEIKKIKEIILFGSVVRGESDKDSDIDLFFNLDKKRDEVEIKKSIEGLLNNFYNSKIAETWKLKGVKNKINFNVGLLDEWKLKRSLISEGICLYGKYKEIPEKMDSFVLFSINPIKSIAKRNKVIREIFGRSEKNYSKKGFLSEFGGKKISPSSFIVNKKSSEDIIFFLKKNKVDFWFFELWTDDLKI